jgi:hypothetical protein
MSVARATEVMARLRNEGIAVREQAGWQSRGNGQTSAYQGIVTHHTATAFANANLGVLINGRPDLSGPLCNSCGWADGSVGIIAAHPANHAGASGGYNTAPLPKTSLFNKMVWGHEIIYPGTSPMTAAQYRTATILSKICVDVFGFSDVNRIKGHAETSITGKWDPGYASGKTIDLNKFRNDARIALNTPVKEVDMELTDKVRMPNWLGTDTPDNTRTVNDILSTCNVWISQTKTAVGELSAKLDKVSKVEPVIDYDLLADKVVKRLAAIQFKAS